MVSMKDLEIYLVSKRNNKVAILKAEKRDQVLANTRLLGKSSGAGPPRRRGSLLWDPLSWFRHGGVLPRAGGKPLAPWWTAWITTPTW